MQKNKGRKNALLFFCGDAESWRFARRPDKQSTGLFSPPITPLCFLLFSRTNRLPSISSPSNSPRISSISYQTKKENFTALFFCLVETRRVALRSWTHCKNLLHTYPTINFRGKLGRWRPRLALWFLSAVSRTKSNRDTVPRLTDGRSLTNGRANDNRTQLRCVCYIIVSI